jgi:hydroxymethylpyrimidine kinase/phosphomethylpyrimidine kinase
MELPKVCLSIAGLDPSGGAGAIADIKTFSAFGCFATAAITSLTFQNTVEVFGATHQTSDTVCRQVEPILRDFEVSAMKTGMLPTAEIIEEVAKLISENGLKNIVVDPVVRSTSGFDLIDNSALQKLIQLLFPLADIITPNIPEAERISGIAISDESDIEDAAQQIQSMGSRNVLIKGGHLAFLDSGFGISDLKTSGKRANDYLFIGSETHVFEAEYIETTSTHGTGCTLSAAIAANLALGNDLQASVEIAKKFVTRAIRTAPGLGHGHSPLNIQAVN